MPIRRHPGSLPPPRQRRATMKAVVTAVPATMRRPRCGSLHRTMAPAASRSERGLQGAAGRPSTRTKQTDDAPGIPRKDSRGIALMDVEAPPRVVSPTSCGRRRPVSIWVSGGWAMVAIAVQRAADVRGGLPRATCALSQQGLPVVPEKTWRRWIDHPGPSGGGRSASCSTSSRATASSRTSRRHLRTRCATTETVPVRARPAGHEASASAPRRCSGLLGTVTGMLSTFGALASGSGGDKTMAHGCGVVSPKPW